VGADIAWLLDSPHGTALIALGMCAFLAAVTQAPITAMIIVMEMTDGHNMVLSLIAGALLASLVSRMISRPLYSTMSSLMMRSLREPGARLQTRDEGCAFMGHASASHTSMSPALTAKMPLLPQALAICPPSRPPKKMPSDMSVL